ncbi:hypothetical protein LUZ60_001385 [Juncus effusus]|nr:hypothetical protein LUZ60_001385 [Juncus effusus]
MTFNAVEAVVESNGECFTMPFKRVKTAIVSKALLSHDPKENPDFTVVIMFGEIIRPAIWRVGDTVWKIIDCPYPLSDVIWYEGELYIYSFRIMYVVDVVGSNPKATKIFTLMSHNMRSSLYLVGFQGNLLLIERFKRRNELTVSRVNLKEGARDGLSNIDDLALFVGNNSALVVDPSGFPGCIPNGIYFINVYASISS